MTEESRAVAVVAPQSTGAMSVWSNLDGFEAAQRMAKALCSSSLVPDTYRGAENMGSALIAIDMAQRVNASPLMVMQNLHVIEGRPSWGSSFIIAALNACGKFSPIRFRLESRGEREAQHERWIGPKGERRKEIVKVKIHDKACVATAIEKATGEVLEGPEVSIAMAVAEGWMTKSGSKWLTMPDLMLRYRAAAFFGRLYAPDLLMGMQTQDEIHDVDYVDVTPAVAPAAAAPAVQEPEPPAPKARRARGVQAAMAAADPAEPKATKPAAQPAPVQTVEAADDVEDAEYDEAGDDDIV